MRQGREAVEGKGKVEERQQLSQACALERCLSRHRHADVCVVLEAFIRIIYGTAKLLKRRFLCDGLLLLAAQAL